MSDMKFTPGPWEIRPRSPLGIASIHTREGGFIADLLTPHSSAERDANGRLIVVAPDMYVALHDVRTVLRLSNAAPQLLATIDGILAKADSNA